MFSFEGICKVFDIVGNGYCCLEGVVVVLLIKKFLVWWVYVIILNVGINIDGFKE